MHNCKETKERLIEIALDEAVLPVEVGRCDECRSEFEALNATLRATTRLRDTVEPSEDYWDGYHRRLREKLFLAKSQRRKDKRKEEFALLFAPLRLCVRTVPVPLGVMVIILFLLLFALRQPAAPPQSPIVIHVPVEVPVVQEKTVTQVVYRDRRHTSKPSKLAAIAAAPETTFARSQPINLDGFKPTDEVKLTVIKGGIPNEK